MRKPDTTYRLQLSPDFKFEDLKKILDYLNDLGISTIYSAPFFQAREGSTHGYDVMDPFNLNNEIGTLGEFKEIGQAIKSRQMSWLQDIVPNHMAYDGANVWLKEIFELGPLSSRYNFFDINWKYKDLNKVMAPFLGGELEEILEKKELKVKIGSNGFSLAYYDNVYPLSKQSYSFILSKTENEEWKNRFDNFDGSAEEWNELKISFLSFFDQNNSGDTKTKIEETLDQINASAHLMKELLDLQFYLPAFWKKTEREINYRRFFTINDLICLRMEDPEVFKSYHTFINDLCEAGLIQGLRIDHIDGLFDPLNYLKSLRKMVGKDFYIVVEKILESGEELPEDWPVQGTSGYEFLAQINHLFTKSSSEPIFSDSYAQIAPDITDYHSLVYEKKLFILKERMGGELDNLMSFLKENSLLPDASLQKEEAYREGLSAILAGFPVYRIYPQKFPLKTQEKEIIVKATEKATEKAPEYTEEISFIKDLFLGEAEKDGDKMLYFLQRCQQFSGPLAAKGVEDTSFYIYNRLASHNEVGDSPENFGISIDDFHKKMLHRRDNLSLAINATATHDTKRGEDARMRLNVLSEIPEEWFSKVQEWKKINSQVRKNKKVPSGNEEYFIYQVLLGGIGYKDEENFLSRTSDYLQKVLREAKIHSNWAEPNEQYEQDVFNFIEDILSHKKFRESFDEFQEKIAGFGALKSLSQTLIKVTAPGIPDIYQGTELWDLSYVDPDNRREVDYSKRIGYLSDFKEFQEVDLKNTLKTLKEEYSNGKVKMYTLHKALFDRKTNADLYQKGNYIPLKLSGKSSDKFIAFARNLEKEYSITIAPVEVTRQFDYKDLNPNSIEDLQVQIPQEFPKKWKNVYTQNVMESSEILSIGDEIHHFPVILFRNKN